MQSVEVLTKGMELPAQPSRVGAAIADLVGGIRRSWIWTALAYQDIRLRYRGSILGPLWITMSAAVMIAAMGTLYSQLFKINIEFYLPYLTLGMILWSYILTIVTDGCQTFLVVGALIQQVPLPYSLHAFRVTYRNVLVMGHNIVILPIVWILFPPHLTVSAFMAIPGFAVLLMNGVWVSILLGMVSARFRDVPPIVTSVVQVVFLVTPIFWSPDLLQNWKALAELNPIFALIDIVRAPLMGSGPAPYSWIVAIVFTCVGSATTLIFFARFRSRIAYWI